MKIPNQLHNKRKKEMQSLYNDALKSLEPYKEQIYNQFKKFKKDQSNDTIRKNVTQIILNSIEKSISIAIEHTKEIFPDYFDDTTPIKVEDVLYNKDGKTLQKRIDEWFEEYNDANILIYHMFLILDTETFNLIPRVPIKKIENNTRVLVEIIRGGGDCATGICDEYQEGQVYFEDEINIPPFHPNCQCQTYEYTQKEVLEDI